MSQRTAGNSPAPRRHNDRGPRPLHEAVVGQMYDVPCVRIVGDTVFPNEFLRPGELVPVLLPAHKDAEYFELPYIHYHVDLRYVSADQWERMQRCSAYVHACIITTSLIGEEPRFQSLRCMRTMPDFPTAGEIAKNDQDSRNESLVTALRGLEAHYRKSRIDTDTLVCPHRGICLKGLPANAGVVVCPAHGLAWNIETGALAVRHHTDDTVNLGKRSRRRVPISRRNSREC